MVNKRKNSTRKSNGESQEHRYYERIKVGDFEREVAGDNPEWVERRMNETIAIVPRWFRQPRISSPKNAEGITQLELPLLEPMEEDTQQNTLLWSDSSVSEVTEITSISVVEPLAADLKSVYRKFAPKNQMESMLIIVFYNQNTLRLSPMDYENLKQAVMELLPLGIKSFSNPRALVSKASKAGFMYKPNLEDGKFALTEKGIEYIKSRLG